MLSISPRAIRAAEMKMRVRGGLTTLFILVCMFVIAALLTGSIAAAFWLTALALVLGVIGFLIT